MNQSANKFKQLNAFAMQYGIALGAWGILSLVTTGVSLKITSLSLLSSIVTLASPVIAALLTSRFRKSTTTPEEGFTFGRAFLFVFTTGFYASIWIAAFVFLYLAYWDNGYIFNAYESLLSSPEYAGSMQQSGLMNSLNWLRIICHLHEFHDKSSHLGHYSLDLPKKSQLWKRKLVV